LTPSFWKRSHATIRTAVLWSGTAVLLATASGCGLSEYERQIEEEQKRVQGLDEENRLLGDPVEAPKIKDASPNATSPVPAPLFLRPPRGIQSKPADAPRAEILYTYSPRYRNPYQMRPGSNDDLPFLRMDVAIAPATPPAGDWTQFVNQVQTAFAGTTAADEPNVTREPSGRPPMVFQARSFTEPAADPKQAPTVYRVYFYKGPQYHVAIAYHLPQAQAKNADVDKCINASLQTLTLGADATPKMDKWKRAHPPATQKTPR
jgi:hypothetical protein